jgi:hypothetical protein
METYVKYAVTFNYVDPQNVSSKCIVTCTGLYVTSKEYSALVIRFIDTPPGTTGHYSAIADLRTLQFTVTHVLGFLAFTSHILATDL